MEDIYVCETRVLRTGKILTLVYPEKGAMKNEHISYPMSEVWRDAFPSYKDALAFALKWQDPLFASTQPSHYDCDDRDD